MTLVERIQLILDEEKIDQVQLGAAAGVTKGTVNQWLSGQIKSIKLEYAVGIEEAYGYNHLWLVLGRPPVRCSELGEKKAGLTRHGATRPVAVVATAAFHDDGTWATADHTISQDSVEIDFASDSERVFAVQCLGDQLSPRVKDREVLVAEPSRKVEPGDEVLLIDSRGRVLFAEYIYESGGRVHLLSANQRHGKISVMRDHIAQMVYVGWIGKPARQTRQASTALSG